MELKMGRNPRKHFGVAARVAGDSAQWLGLSNIGNLLGNAWRWRAFSLANARAALVQMAQVWLRLADEKKIDDEKAQDEG